MSLAYGMLGQAFSQMGVQGSVDLFHFLHVAL